VKIVVDSYAWIEVFSGTAKGEEAKKNMEQAESVLTPDIVLAEVARKYFRAGIAEGTIRKRLATILEASEPAHIDDITAIAAAMTSSELEKKAKEARSTKPSLFDAIVLAIARTNQAKVLTGDKHFENLPETIWLGN
jgi:predicted nucleic acid-binding protein